MCQGRPYNSGSVRRLAWTAAVERAHHRLRAWTPRHLRVRGAERCWPPPRPSAPTHDLRRRLGASAADTRLAESAKPARGDSARLAAVTNEVPNPRRVERDEIYRLRGEFLSEMAVVEDYLHLMICVYFQIPAELRQVFTAWVLGGMTFDAKIELASKATRSTETGSTMKPVIAKLRELKNARNEAAHAAVSVDFTSGSRSPEEWPWASSRWTRSGYSRQVVTVDGLGLLVRRAQATSPVLMAITNEMATAADRVVPLDVDWVGATEKLVVEYLGDIPRYAFSDELGRYLFDSTQSVEPEGQEGAMDAEMPGSPDL